MFPLQTVGHAPKTTELTRQIVRTSGTCVGCEGCTGLCKELIDVLVLPEIFLRKGS